MSGFGQSAITIDTTITCLCDDSGMKTKDSIVISSTSPKIWLDSYSGFVLPDSVLYHEADETIDEFYLSTDEPEKDTLTSTTTNMAGRYVFSFVSYRNPTVAFTSIVFADSTSTATTSYEACTFTTDAIVTGSGQTMLCLNQDAVFQFDSLQNAMIQNAMWNINGIDPMTGSGTFIQYAGTGSGSSITYSGEGTGSGTRLRVTWLAPGDYTINVSGSTVKNCPIDASLDVTVIDTDFDIEGFDFSCRGDTMRLDLSDGFSLAVFDSVIWTVSDTSVHFVGDSIDVASTMVSFDSSGTYDIRVAAYATSGAMCSFFDTLSVTVADTLDGGLVGDTLLCLDATRTYYANVLHAESLTWTSVIGTVASPNNLDSTDITYNTAGMDTIRISGMTTMGCIIRDTLVVDIKDSQIMLAGDQLACIGDTLGYRAMYTDSSIASFVTIEWSIVPMDGGDIIEIDSLNDSLTVHWNEIGDYEIRVNGVTDLGCELRDTFAVNVQDTEYEILGEQLACVYQPSQFYLVQSADSSNVADSLITWRVIRDTGAAIDVVESLTDTDGNDTLNHQFTTGTFTDATFYYVIANGMSSNGCPVSDTIQVEVIGNRDLAIQGPDNLCSGADGQFVLGISDTLLTGPLTWSVRQKSNNAPLVPAALDASRVDTLLVAFPNIMDTFIVQATGMIEGQCDFTISKEVILTDSVGIINAADIDTTCLSQDSQWYVLNVDTSQVDIADVTFDIRRVSDGTVFFPNVTNSGSNLGAYTTWQTAGEYILRIRGNIENGGCDINETLNITVKDTAYVIDGDKQICIGDTLEYVLLQGWNNAPITDFTADSVNWVVDTMFADVIETRGAIGDTIRILWTTPGKYGLSVMDSTQCCPINVLDSVLIRGGDERFIISGDSEVCVDDVRGYVILNPDSSYIDDLIPDSSMWTVSLGTRVNASTDSVTVRYDVGTDFVNLQDTIWFSGMTDDGCEVLDTFYVNIQNTEVFIFGDTEICQGDDVELAILNSADSTVVAGLTSVRWILMPGDTLMDDDTLSVYFDSSGVLRPTWTEAGLYNVSALGYIGDSCVISATTAINVNMQPSSGIMGDLNTCVNSRDVYSVDIPMSMVDTIFWEIKFYSGTDTTGGAPFIVSGQNTTEVDIQWGKPGEYFIEVNGVTTGGCPFMYSLDITLVDAANIGQLSCNNAINVTLNDQCELMLTPDMILEEPDPSIPDEQYEIVVTDAASGTMLSTGLVDPSLLGIELKIEITHECSGQTCWGYVTLEDKNIPELICGRDTVECDANILPRFLNFGPERRLGYPVPSTISNITQTITTPPTFRVVGYEKCGDATLTYNDRVEEEICDGDFGTIIYRDWSMSNSSGLTSTCTDTILIKRVDIDSIDLTVLPSFVGEEAFDCTVSESSLQPGGLTGNLNLSTDPYCFNIQTDFSDEKTIICGGGSSYRIIRTWTIFDWCSGDVRKHIQIIEVLDREGPSITLRTGDINIEADDHSCTGLYDLTPDVIYSDNCSGIQSTTLRIFENDITGNLLYTITDGDYSGLSFDESVTKILIDFVARDSCDRQNEDQVMRNIKITDNVMPVPSCDENTTISIGSNGWAVANWHAFDDQSWDNCGIDRICVTRMDDLDAFEALDGDNNNLVPYAQFKEVASCPDAYDARTTVIGSVEMIHKDSLCGPYVKFCCADAMDTSAVLIRMDVFDLSGNTNFCMVNANVQDNSAVNKQITAGDITISCQADVTPFLTDDGSTVTFLTTTCGVPLAPDSFSAAVDTNMCGVGSIVRTWRITDDFNNSLTHTQTVTIGLANEIFDPAILSTVWPEDFEGEGCAGPGSEPENLDPQYVPNIDLTAYPCSQLGLDHEDLPFYNVEGYCTKILRTWTLRDWCKRDPNNPDAGKWTYVQLLKLNDTEDPIITTGCETETFEATNRSNCSAFVSTSATADDCLASEDLIWSYVIKDADDATVIAGNTPTVNTNLSVGTYQLTWNAKDRCGNMAECVKTINVVDAQAPTIECRSMTLAIADNGNLDVSASEFITLGDDNCSDNADLLYAFQSGSGSAMQTYTCTDLNGLASRDFTLQIFVSDQAGNSTSCSVILTITDANEACGTTNGIVSSVEGVIYTEEDFTIDEVEVNITEMGTGEKDAMMTPLEGKYEFKSLASTETYEISANREDDYMDGVSTFDIILIQRHILGLRDLETPYKLIAADVDASGSVSTADLVHLRKLLLGKSVDLPIGQSWTFIDAQQTWENNLKPFPYSQKLTISSPEEDKDDMDFIGVKMGDVNASVELQSSLIGITRSIEALELKEVERRGDDIRIAVTPANRSSIAGLQLNMNFDQSAIRVTNIESDVIDIPYEQVRIEGGQLRLTWNAIESITLPEDEVLFYITVNTKEAVDIEKLFDLNAESLTSEVYHLSGDDVDVSDIYLDIKDADGGAQEDLIVMQNSPNPFKGETSIRFYQNQNSTVDLRVYDLTGKVLHTNTASYAKGWHKMTIDSKDVGGAGAYIYEISNGQQSIRKKMITVE